MEIAYCKIFYPLAYYAAYFSIRATAFSYELMCQGKEKLEYFMDDYEKRKDSLTKKEQDTYKDMRNVQEMYARGFEFMPIDIYKANAHTFQIIEGKLMPALDTIEGLGDRAADAVVGRCRRRTIPVSGRFSEPTKVTASTIDLMTTWAFSGTCLSPISCPYLTFNKKIYGVFTEVSEKRCISIRKTIQTSAFPEKLGKLKRGVGVCL